MWKFNSGAQTLLQKGFQKSVDELQDWLRLGNLLNQYQTGFATAIQAGTAAQWLEESVQPVWKQKKRTVAEWVYKACDFFEQPRPVDLWVGWQPPVEGATAEDTGESAGNGDSEKSRLGKTKEIAPVAIATGLGWVLGGPMGAAVLAGTSHLINQSGRKSKPSPSEPAISPEVCRDAARTYLAHFSETALEALNAYKITANKVLHTPIVVPPSKEQQHGQRALLENILAELRQLQTENQSG